MKKPAHSASPATLDSNVVVLNHINAKHDKETQDLDPDLELAFHHLVKYLKRGHTTESELANFEDTAVRAAKAFRELTASREDITTALQDILKTGFPRESHDGQNAGLVTQGPIQVFSLCPHHLLQVEYSVFVSYIPNKDNGLVLGLSKLARIAKLLGRRPILQEQLASDIADVLHRPHAAPLLPEHASSTVQEVPAEENDTRFPGMASQGSAVLLTGKHSCMTCRGIHSSALTSVTELRGSFWKDSMEQKFYQAIAAINSSGLR